MSTIRLLRPDDTTAYSALRLEALEREPLAFGSSAEEHRALSPDAIAACLGAKPDGGFHLGAFLDGDLIGTVYFHRNGRVKDRHIGGVVGMYVTPVARGRGMGRALLLDLLGRVREDASLIRVNLAVATHAEAARALYRACGFVAYGVEPQAIRHAGKDADVELMSLALRGHEGIP